MLQFSGVNHWEGEWEGKRNKKEERKHQEPATVESAEHCEICDSEREGEKGKRLGEVLDIPPYLVLFRVVDEILPIRQFGHGIFSR